MKDLTQGSITRHLFGIAVTIAVGVLVQNLYFLVDLYFVARLGYQAVAGVGAAGNAVFVVFSLTEVLGVGTVALVSHATGRADRAAANLIFNRSLALSAVCAVAVLLIGYVIGGRYMRSVGADPATIAAGITYLHWYLPGLALQFAMVSMIWALRGIGVVRPATIAQLVSVAVNVVLAPILIVGWGTGRPLGVAGAALASSISVAIAVAILLVDILKKQTYISFDRRLWRADGDIWSKILKLGWPAGGELAFTFIYIAVVYWTIRDLGSEAQAGFGIALRIMQALYLPALAVSFAVTPLAGQNFGARLADRVRQTVRVAAIIVVAEMAVLTLLCQVIPIELMGLFTSDRHVIAVGTVFLRIVSWHLVPYGLIWTCSGLFQAVGNTLPSLTSNASRVLTFALPAAWLSMRADFHIEQLWYLWVISVVLQCLLSFALIRTEFRRKLIIADI